MKKLIIKDRKKFNRFIVMASLVLAVLVYAIMSMFFPTPVRGLSDNTTMVVSHGDTLWDIALSLDADKDVREVVYDIYEINNISRDGSIKAGQVLQLPSY